MKLKEAMLFPFLKESRDTYVPHYVPINEDVINSSTLNFYIFYGKNTIVAQKIIVENDKYEALHDIYRYYKARVLHNDVPPRFIRSLCSHQNMFNKQYADTPFID